MRGDERVERGSSTSDEDFNKSWMFVGYVAGVCDMMRVDWPESTRGQIVAVAAKHIREHPELWSELAFEMVEQAIIEAFELKR